MSKAVVAKNGPRSKSVVPAHNGEGVMKLGRILEIALKRFFESIKHAAKNRLQVMKGLQINQGFLGMLVSKGRFWSAWESAANRLEWKGMDPIQAAQHIAEQTLCKLGYIQTRRASDAQDIQRIVSIVPTHSIGGSDAMSSVMRRLAEIQAMN